MSDHDYVAPWYAPRHGVRAALRAWATAAVLVGIAWALARAAAGQDADPFSTAVRDAEGGIRCHLTPMDNGVWTAGHCLNSKGPEGPIGGDWPYSIDPVRDLGHIAIPSMARSQTTRAAVIGERVEWRNARGTGAGFVAATWWSRGQTSADADIETLPQAGPGWYTVAIVCHDGGRRVIKGDSGSGVWADDGALLGIVARAAMTKRAAAWGPCGGRQWFAAVPVP